MGESLPEPTPSESDKATENKATENKATENKATEDKATETTPKREYVASPDSEEKIFYEPPSLSEAQVSGDSKRGEKSVGAETSSPLPALAIAKENTDLPETVQDAVDLPEAVNHTESPERVKKSGELQESTGDDGDKIAHVDDEPPRYLAGSTGQPSGKEAYQPTRPMSLEKTENTEKTGAVVTVTPLRLLGDQSDWVDCPFCRRRVETRVEKKPSRMTYIAGTALCLTTFLGTFVPCWYKWYYNVDHHCANCDRIVAHREYNKKEVEVLGTLEHEKEVSQYPAAP